MQFGTMVGDETSGGIVEASSAVLLSEYVTLAVNTLLDGEDLPVIALEMTGRISKKDITIGVVYLMSVVDAGQLAGALYHAAHRIESSTAKQDFGVGVSLGSKGERL